MCIPTGAFRTAISKRLQDKPFLILVNKHDMNAVDAQLLKHQIRGDRWRAFNVSVKTGKGLDEALVWFTNNVFT